MERRLDRIMARLFDVPLLIAEDHGLVIARVVTNLIQAGAVTIDSPEMLEADPVLGAQLNRFYGTTHRTTGKQGLSRLAGNTAIVTINGELVNRGAWIGSSSGLVSYEGMVIQLKDVLNDPEAQNVLIDFNTPGGEAAGIEAAAQGIRELAAVKHTVAFINSNSMSGGQWLAAQANEVVATPSSNLGSIGVIVYHADRSKQMKKDGIKITAITAGAHKGDFSSLGPLSSDAQARLQDHVEKIYTRFVAGVALGRGDKLKADAIRKMGALIYTGEDAVKVGLADRIASFDDVLAELQQRSPGRRANGGPIAKATETGLRTDSTGKTGADAMSDDVKAAEAAATKAANENGAKIMKLCNDGGVPQLAMGFLQSGASVAAVETRVAECAQIRAAVKAAVASCSVIDPSIADTFINGGASLAHVNAQLMGAITESAGKSVIKTGHDAGAGKDAPQGVPETHEAVQTGWKSALKNAGAYAHDRPAMQRIKMRG